MSKQVKTMISDAIKSRLKGVNNLLLINLAGLDANKNNQLRMELKQKNIQLMMVKNSMARRATEGTPLAVAFEQMEGSMAMIWGGEDIVSLAKELIRYTDDKKFAPLAPRGGVMDGAQLTAEMVKEVSKWPSRTEQLSILAGQIISLGGKLSSQFLAMGGALASQIKQKSEETSQEGAPEEAAPAG